MNNEMTEVQRALWLAYLEADKAVDRLVAEKSDAKPGSIDLFEWRGAFNEALGFRDGLHKACVISKVPNFKDD